MKKFQGIFLFQLLVLLVLFTPAVLHLYGMMSYYPGSRPEGYFLFLPVILAIYYWEFWGLLVLLPALFGLLVPFFFGLWGSNNIHLFLPPAIGLIFSAVVFLLVLKMGQRIVIQSTMKKDFLLESLFNELPLEFWAIDKKQRVVFQSKHSKNLWGDVIGKKIEDLTFLDDRFKEELRSKEKALSGGKMVVLEEKRYKEHLPFYYQTYVAPILHQKNRIGLIAANINITESKMLNEELFSTNRFLRCISRCNEALMYMKDEKSLLKSLAFTLVTDGGFDFALFRFIDESRGNHYYPVSNSPVSSLYTFYIENDTCNHCSYKKAKTERFPNAVNNLLDVSKKCKDCAIAVRAGLKSCASFPLSTDGKIIGTLSLYSSEKDHFTEQTLAQLEELINHITYGINNLNTKKETELLSLYLKQSEEKYRALTTYSRDAIFLFDIEQKLLEINRRSESLFEYEVEELFENTFQKIIAPEDYDRMNLWWKRLTEMKAGEIYDITGQNKTGEKIPLDIAGQVIHLEDQTIIQTIIRDMSYRKKAQEEIRRYEARLRRMAAELSLAQERERRSLSALLHDTVAQNLAISKIQLSFLKPSLSEKTLSIYQSVLKMLDLSIKQSRNLMSELSPPMLFELGLDATLEWLAEHYETHHKIHLQFEHIGKKREVSQDVKLMIFQVSRELLNNMVKYAETDSGNISLQTNEYEARLVIKDQGKGFDPAELDNTPDEQGGYGLFSIRERVNAYGGKMELRSAPGKGTKVKIILPMKEITE